MQCIPLSLRFDIEASEDPELCVVWLVGLCKEPGRREKPEVWNLFEWELELDWEELVAFCREKQSLIWWPRLWQYEQEGLSDEGGLVFKRLLPEEDLRLFRWRKDMALTSTIGRAWACRCSYCVAIARAAFTHDFIFYFVREAICIWFGNWVDKRRTFLLYVSIESDPCLKFVNLTRLRIQINRLKRIS